MIYDEEIHHILKIMKLKIKNTTIPPDGNKLITNIEQLDKYTIKIKEKSIDKKVEKSKIGYVGKYPIIFHRIKYTLSEDESLVNIMLNYAEIGWHEAFIASIDNINNIDNKIKINQEKIVPSRPDIFKCFDCSPYNVKVVIMGQDPYYQVYDETPVAMGYCFSVRRGNDVPDSLRNIYKEIKKDYNNFTTPNHGDLTNWVKQGILLLNASLTTIAGTPNAHKGLWDGFIYHILQYLVHCNKNIIFVLWGANAKKLVSSILGSSKYIFFESSHPSPWAYSKGRNPFENCGHFKSINDKLIELGKSPIDWNSIND